MRIKVFAVLISTVLMFFNIEVAHAKKGFIPVSVPTGYVEKVVDLPDEPPFKYKEGVYVDIGYLHNFIGKDKWVGYIGSATSYVELKEGALEFLVLSGYLEKKPSPPKSTPFINMAIYALWIGSLVLVGKVLLRQHKTGQPAPSSDTMHALNEEQTASPHGSTFDKNLQARFKALALENARVREEEQGGSLMDQSAQPTGWPATPVSQDYAAETLARPENPQSYVPFASDGIGKHQQFAEKQPASSVAAPVKTHAGLTEEMPGNNNLSQPGSAPVFGKRRI